MIALKLVRLIESHSDDLAKRLMARFDRRLTEADDLCRVPRPELEQRAYEVYKHLTDWLLYKTETDIEMTYTELGMRRAAQRVPFGHFFWAIVTTREVLWEFLQDEGVADNPVDLLGGFELLRMLERFFDKALYYATLGYQRGKAEIAEPVAEPATANMARFVP